MPDFDFARMRGVVPAVLQDADFDAVLSVGCVVVRAASGDPALVQEVLADCDRDDLLVRARIDGVLLSENATPICFTEALALDEGRRED